MYDNTSTPRRGNGGWEEVGEKWDHPPELWRVGARNRRGLGSERKERERERENPSPRFTTNETNERKRRNPRSPVTHANRSECRTVDILLFISEESGTEMRVLPSPHS